MNKCDGLNVQELLHYSEGYFPPLRTSAGQKSAVELLTVDNKGDRGRYERGVALVISMLD